MKKMYRRLFGMGLLCLGVAGCSSSNPDVLRHIVMDKCVPNSMNTNSPKPCAEVNTEKGYVVLKDLNGPLQYLIMPTAKLDGMESPELLNKTTTNFLWKAWQSRHFMSEKLGKPIPENVVSLTINSAYARTQNHLHIHLSCTASDVQTTLLQQEKQIGTQWKELSTKLKGEYYMARRITAKEFEQKSPFLWLTDIPNASGEMGKYSVAVTPASNGDFILLATKHQWLPFNKAASEDLQDHSCKLLGL
ncbi:CDP-diacylglycerol diphosphatase [Vespertiliibacter pulmonis]|uniref:CDP-diacylglycerol pyrophosphatase n=1 Tax=Vespertiliibacter pulmonis TaxID=1443036 RepID=A0A3N4VXT8_9PAST|nr:CDP-diacylglycerol diphosphatase [Vespertiliibacter pulmonis]QLB20189.1 CDP-diacylglycerol diphosphatase [Vespertiliibacter pulmonis]RPE86163.1 CDP-diacylglycerol pyrophosphatase [Vespertiliibacter pulmonis]